MWISSSFSLSFALKGFTGPFSRDCTSATTGFGFGGLRNEVEDVVDTDLPCREEREKTVVVAAANGGVDG